ncbi:hypothetical protein WMY93_008038 [Mugilogobius chulae]|uniref:Anti-proliferative protein domain-containing protein n=1 Tax=Mugilogobius chulae TaxID=88201 RepID=A0AAW0PF12_9GOBI
MKSESAEERSAQLYPPAAPKLINISETLMLSSSTKTDHCLPLKWCAEALGCVYVSLTRTLVYSGEVWEHLAMRVNTIESRHARVLDRRSSVRGDGVFLAIPEAGSAAGGSRRVRRRCCCRSRDDEPELEALHLRRNGLDCRRVRHVPHRPDEDAAAVQGQSQYTEVRYRGMFHALFRIGKEEGIRALYSGISPALLRQASYGTIKIGTYNTLKRFFVTRPEDETMVINVFCGVVSGVLSSSLANPTDVLKIRMQAQGSLLQGSMMSNFMNIYQTEGTRGLWRGVIPTAQRAAIVVGVELPVYDITKKHLLRSGLMGDTIGAHFISSFTCGLAGALASNPVDVVRTRMMNQRVLSGAPLYKGTMDGVMQTWKNEGFFALYKGFWPNWLRLGPWNIIVSFTFNDKAYHKLCLGQVTALLSRAWCGDNMKEEIAAAVFFVARLVKRYGGVDAGGRDRFAAALTSVLFESYKNHWHPNAPSRGQAYRCLRMNRAWLRDPILQQACERSLVRYEDLGCLWSSRFGSTREKCPAAQRPLLRVGVNGGRRADGEFSRRINDAVERASLDVQSGSSSDEDDGLELSLSMSSNSSSSQSTAGPATPVTTATPNPRASPPSATPTASTGSVSLHRERHRPGSRTRRESPFPEKPSHLCPRRFWSGAAVLKPEELQVVSSHVHVHRAQGG